MTHRKTLLVGSALAVTMITSIASTSPFASSRLQVLGDIFSGCSCINDDTSKVLAGYKQKGAEIGVTDTLWFKTSTEKFAGQIETRSGFSFVDSVIATLMGIEPGADTADKLMFALTVVDSAKLSLIDLEAIHGILQYKAHQLVGKSGNITVYDMIDALSARILSMKDADDSDSTDKTAPIGGGTYAKDRATSGADKSIAA
jgi:hypothetical protein